MVALYIQVIKQHWISCHSGNTNLKCIRVCAIEYERAALFIRFLIIMSLFGSLMYHAQGIVLLVADTVMGSTNLGMFYASHKLSIITIV